MKKILFFIFASSLSILINNSQAQWVQVSNGIANRNVRCLTSSGSYIFAGMENYYGIYYSSNYGDSWILRGLPANLIYSLAANDNYIFAGLDTEICRSSDYGITWTHRSFLNPSTISSIALSGNNVILSSQNLGTAEIYHSSDNGSNWNYLRAITGGSSIVSVFQNHFYISSGSPPYTLYHSSNFGLNWTSSMIWPLGKPLCIGAFSNYIYAGTSKPGTFDSIYGFCTSSDYGMSWAITGLLKKNISAITVSGNNVIAGTKDSGIYVSTNNGFSWVKRNEGLPTINTTNTLHIFNNYVYAGILNQAVWRRPLTELINGINTISSEVPETFKLFQNYPNPFNPNTNIRYQISNNKYIKLKVYDLLGKEVASLVDKKQEAGIYEVSFDANNLSSGMYFYSLYADEVRMDTKRMVLIK